MMFYPVVIDFFSSWKLLEEEIVVVVLDRIRMIEDERVECFREAVLCIYRDVCRFHCNGPGEGGLTALESDEGEGKRKQTRGRRRSNAEKRGGTGSGIHWAVKAAEDTQTTGVGL